MDLGAPELLIILVVVLVIFGGAKLPKLARSLGEAQRELRKGFDGDPPTPPTPPAATPPEGLPPADPTTDAP
jgi:sec-independent protein translocase protein TatA